MTDVQLLAFVITPLTLLAIGWAVALWAVRDVRRHRSAAE
jgi:type IV secretory pathway TrbL component